MAVNKKKKPSKSAVVGKKRANRRPNGQFGPGNNCGTAPYSKIDREWRLETIAALREVVPRERLVRQFEAVARKADYGNIDALKFELDYLLGKPAQQVNLGSEDGGPLEITVNVTPPKNK